MTEDVKSKKPTKKDIETKPLLDWAQVEKALLKKFSDRSWNAERHRANPQHTVGIVISTVMPEVIKLLK